MGLQYDNSLMHSLAVPNTQTVLFESAISDAGTFAPAQDVDYALRRAPTKEEQDYLPHIGVVWHLSAHQIPGAVVPKKRDRITDQATGQRWQIEKVDIQAWGQRFRCLTFLENF